MPPVRLAHQVWQVSVESLVNQDQLAQAVQLDVLVPQALMDLQGLQGLLAELVQLELLAQVGLLEDEVLMGLSVQLVPGAKQEQRAA